MSKLTPDAEFERRASKTHDYEGNLVGYYISADDWREIRAILTARLADRDARLAAECERGDSLEGMCDRLAGSHVDLQDAVAWALAESLAWRDRMPRTRENNTYPNGRQDGVDAVVRIVRAAMSAHLRGEDPAALNPDPSEACPTHGCQGDPQYAAPGRHHAPDCRYPIAPDPSEGDADA